MIRAFAERLQALLAERLGISLPIVEERNTPGIVIVDDSSHDPYNGSTYYAWVTVDRPPLYVQFRFSEHELSGQCDEWSLVVRGARDEDRAAFGEVFHPRLRNGAWGNYVPVYTFSGVPASFD